MIEMGFPMNRLHQNWTMADKVVTSITGGINNWQKRPVSSQAGRRNSITWTVDVNETITRMIRDGFSYAQIASELGNGLKGSDFVHMWTRSAKTSGIIKPPAQAGRRSSITWTADAHETITRMIGDGVSYAQIASELGNGLKRNDI